MHTPRAVAYTLLLASSPAFAATYNLLKAYQGQNFFDGWDFADGFDNTTNGACFPAQVFFAAPLCSNQNCLCTGAVNWLNQSASTTAGLTSFNSDGHVIIKVDDTTNLPNATVVTDQQKRDSVCHSWAHLTWTYTYLCYICFRTDPDKHARLLSRWECVHL